MLLYDKFYKICYTLLRDETFAQGKAIRETKDLNVLVVLVDFDLAVG